MLDRISAFIAIYRGVPVLLGALMVLINFVVVLVAPEAWLARTNLLLHLGVVVGLLGILLGDMLGH